MITGPISDLNLIFDAEPVACDKVGCRRAAHHPPQLLADQVAGRTRKEHSS